jgi:hypothetical protein
MNYYYPAKVISDFKTLAQGDYGVFNNTLYFNKDGIILIVKHDFLYYDLDDGELFVVASDCKKGYCKSGVLFNMKDSQWVLFKTQEVKCGDGCITTIDRVLCKCDNIDPECFNNYTEGVSNIVNGLANNIEGNDITLHGFFDYISGSDQTFPGIPITTSGMQLTRVNPTRWRLVIPEDVRSLVYQHDYLLFPTPDRWYSMAVIEFAYNEDDSILTLFLEQTINCNEIPPLGQIDIVIPTTNFQSVVSGTMNIIDAQKSGNFAVRDKGSYIHVIGNGNTLTGSRYTNIHGNTNSTYDIFSFNASADGTTDYPTADILPLNTPFNIMYVNGSETFQGQATLTNNGTDVVVDPILPVGFYRFMFIDAIRVRPSTVVPLDTIIPELGIFKRNFTFVRAINLDGSGAGLLVVKKDTDGLRLYNFFVANGIITFTTVSTFNNGYLNLYNDKLSVSGNSNRVNGYNNTISGFSNTIASSNSLTYGQFNNIEGGAFNFIHGFTNNFNSPSVYYSCVFGDNNSIPLTDYLVSTNTREKRNNFINGSNISVSSSYANCVGSNYQSLFSYNMSVGIDNKSVNRMIGYFSGSLDQYTLTNVEYFNGVPVSNNGNVNGLIANVGGTLTTTRGFSTQTGIQYITFPDSYDSTTPALSDICLAVLDGTYQIIINPSWTSALVGGVLQKYVAPTYEARFTIASGVITTTLGVLTNNQHIFISSNNSVYSLSDTSISTPINTSCMLFIDQPRTGFISVGMVALGSAIPTLNGTFNVVITKL